MIVVEPFTIKNTRVLWRSI